MIWLKCFHYSLNIVVILAPGCEFLSAKCDQFFNIYWIELNDGNFSSGIFIIHFWNKPYEINFKGHGNIAILCK